jgi:hypothetical protein
MRRGSACAIFVNIINADDFDFIASSHRATIVPPCPPNPLRNNRFACSVVSRCQTSSTSAPIEPRRSFTFLKHIMALQTLHPPRAEVDVGGKLATATLNFTKRSLFNILHARKALPKRCFERDSKGELSGLKPEFSSLRPAVDALNNKSLVEAIKNKSVRKVSASLLFEFRSRDSFHSLFFF